MKTTKRLFLQTMFVMALLSTMIACETDCEPKETIVENKLTPEILSYFPYDSLDTIHCIIDSQQYLTIQSFEKVEGINKRGKYSEAKCGGINVVYQNHYRRVEYYDQDGRLILNVKLDIVSRLNVPGNDIYMNIIFDFNNLSIPENHTIAIDRFDLPDTLTHNGYLYDDIFVYYENAREYALYYSKSVGLIKITEGGKPLFQLM